jgi:enoyl-CoA hydratase
MVSVMRRLMESERPTICAVEGAVRAGGIGLMASCDLVAVRSDVTFALTEVRIGVAPAIISVPILRRVPPGKIVAAMLTGEPFTADTACDMGLVNHVSDDVDETVAAWCQGVRAGAPRAVAETKRLLRHVPGLEVGTAFDEMKVLSEELFRGPDAIEGMAAFREKRTPVWPT